MTAVLYQQTVENPLAEQTDWGDHELIAIVVHNRFTYNSIAVSGVVEIIQMSADDAAEHLAAPFEDFRDMEGEGRVETTPAGARALAAALIAAADAAEAALAQTGGDA